MTALYCPQCGERQFQNTSANRYLCASCNFEFFRNVASAVGVMIMCEQKVLFIQRGKAPQKGKWALPGGFVDIGETPEQAMVRECFEEVGFTFSAPPQFLGAWPNEYLYSNVLYHTLDMFFTLTLTQKPSLQLDNLEACDYRWVEFSELAALDIAFPTAKQAVVALMASL